MITSTEPSATGEEMVALELRGVSSGYHHAVVTRDINLRVLGGQVTAVLGPNGAGKTTLLKTISGLLPASAGTILLHGKDVTRARTSDRVRRGLSHIPEGRGIFRSLSVRENLRLQAEPGKEGEAVDLAVAAFPILGRRLNQRAGTLSGGEQQMLAMCRAYSRDSNLILFDEPSLGLAPVIVDEIFEFLRGVASRGAALVLVDQFVTRALDLASDVYLMNKGEMVFRGSPEEVAGDDVFERYLGT